MEPATTRPAPSQEEEEEEEENAAKSVRLAKTLQLGVARAPVLKCYIFFTIVDQGK